MAIHKCPKCDYTTKTKQNIIKHLNKLTPCKNEVIVYEEKNSKEELLNKIIELEYENDLLQDKIIELEEEIKTKKHHNNKKPIQFGIM